MAEIVTRNYDEIFSYYMPTEEEKAAAKKIKFKLFKKKKNEKAKPEPVKEEEVKTEETTTAKEEVKEEVKEEKHKDVKVDEKTGAPIEDEEIDGAEMEHPTEDPPEEDKPISDDIPVRPDEGQFDSLIKPFTFEGSIDDMGRVVGEEPVENANPENAEYDTSNPYLAAKQAQHKQIEEAMKNQPTVPLSDNSKFFAKYPQLQIMEKTIRELNLDVCFSQRPDKIINGCVLANGVFMPTASFMVDLDGVVIGQTNKWFNTYINQMTNPEILENYFALRISNTELLKKYVTDTGTIDDMKRAAIYSPEYLAVNGIVDLSSLPNSMNDEIRGKIVNRIYKAIEAKVFDEFRHKDMERFVFDRYTSPVSYSLKSPGSDITITVNKDNFIVSTQ